MWAPLNDHRAHNLRCAKEAIEAKHLQKSLGQYLCLAETKVELFGKDLQRFIKFVSRNFTENVRVMVHDLSLGALGWCNHTSAQTTQQNQSQDVKREKKVRFRQTGDLK